METARLDVAYKILIVDDDENLLQALSRQLKLARYDVAFAVDGISAISAAQAEKPDLIILDLGLPAGDGFKVMERIKSITRLIDVPIITLTGKDARTCKERALEAGAKVFLEKPVPGDVLLAAIRSKLGEAES